MGVHVPDKRDKRTAMSKILFASLIILALLVSACGDKEKQEEESSSVEAGERVFQERCAGCHTLTGAAKSGPGLGQLFERKTLSNGKAFSREALKELITQGSGGGRMPGVQLESEPLEQLILYLEQATAP
jgi:mono/diheme cytochrome c family protein